MLLLLSYVIIVNKRKANNFDSFTMRKLLSNIAYLTSATII